MSTAGCSNHPPNSDASRIGQRPGGVDTPLPRVTGVEAATARIQQLGLVEHG